MSEVLKMYNADGTSFYDAELESYTFSDTALEFDTSIEGSFVSELDLWGKFTNTEWVEYQVNPTGDKTKFYLVNAVTRTRSGDMSGSDKGLWRYSCKLNDVSIELETMPFKNKLQGLSSFSFAGSALDLIYEIESSLTNGWTVSFYDIDSVPTTVPDDVLTFSDATIASGLNTLYDEFRVTYTKADKVIWIGKPTIDVGHDFSFGDGLKTDNATPKNNDVITMVTPIGVETNIPYPYPKIYDSNGDMVTTYKFKNSSGDIVSRQVNRYTLMPPVYRNSLQEQVDNLLSDDSNIDDYPVIDYYTTDDIEDPIALYNPDLPANGNVTADDDIKPSIEGMTYNDVAIDELVGVSYYDDDNDEVDYDTGEIEKSWFFLTLPPMGFDLWASAAVTGEMTFSMKSGDTIGANYAVAVDDDEWKSNFYETDDDGNLVFTSSKSSRDYASFPDSTNQSITVEVYKDIDTFGELMPSDILGRPVAGDKYVILYIELPDQYVYDAEQKLEDYALEYLADNNYHQYTYPLTLDEGYLYENPEIARQITTNATLTFSLGGEYVTQPIESLTKSHGVDKITTYSITVTDELEANVNAVTANASAIKDLTTVVTTNNIVNTTASRRNSYATQQALNGIFDSEGNNRIDDVEARVVYANAALYGQNANDFSISGGAISFDNSANTIDVGAPATIAHNWADIADNKDYVSEWIISNALGQTLDPNEQYYLYVVANRINSTALWEVSTDQHTYDENEDVFYLVAGQMIWTTSGWTFVATHGMTSVLGGTITTQVTKSPNYELSADVFSGMMIDFLNSRIYMGDNATIVTNKLLIRKPDSEDVLSITEELGRIETLIDSDTEEYIYTVISTNDTTNLPTLTNDADTDDYIPDGWYDNAQNVTTALPYQFRAERLKADGVWGNFGNVILYNSMGTGVSTIVTYFGRSSSTSTVPSYWYTTVPTLTTTYKYLWSYTRTTFSDGTYIDTDKGVIGSLGTDGTNGVGISSVVVYYGVSSSSTEAPIAWSTGIPTLTSTNRYLWSYMEITYTDTTSIETDKGVIGSLGVDGINTSSYLEDVFDKESWVDIDGVALSSFLGVKDSDGNITGGLNGGTATEIPLFFAGASDETVQGAKTARAVIEHNGSGHVANGNIAWDEDGIIAFNAGGTIINAEITKFEGEIYADKLKSAKYRDSTYGGVFDIGSDVAFLIGEDFTASKYIDSGIDSGNSGTFFNEISLSSFENKSTITTTVKNAGCIVHLNAVVPFQAVGSTGGYAEIYTFISFETSTGSEVYRVDGDLVKIVSGGAISLFYDGLVAIPTTATKIRFGCTVISNKGISSITEYGAGVMTYSYAPSAYIMISKNGIETNKGFITAMNSGNILAGVFMMVQVEYSSSGVAIVNNWERNPSSILTTPTITRTGTGTYTITHTKGDTNYTVFGIAEDFRSTNVGFGVSLRSISSTSCVISCHKSGSAVDGGFTLFFIDTSIY